MTSLEYFHWFCVVCAFVLLQEDPGVGNICFHVVWFVTYLYEDQCIWILGLSSSEMLEDVRVRCPLSTCRTYSCCACHFVTFIYCWHIYSISLPLRYFYLFVSLLLLNSSFCFATQPLLVLRPHGRSKLHFGCPSLLVLIFKGNILLTYPVLSQA